MKIQPDGSEVHYRYDALGRLVSVDDGQWPLADEYDLQDRPQRGRREVASDFYRSQGFYEAAIPGHLNGIDFTRPVNVETINKGKKVYQFQSLGAPQGNYYSISASTSPSELGIGALGENRKAGGIEAKLKGLYVTNKKQWS